LTCLRRSFNNPAWFTPPLPPLATRCTPRFYGAKLTESPILPAHGPLRGACSASRLANAAAPAAASWRCRGCGWPGASQLGGGTSRTRLPAMKDRQALGAKVSTVPCGSLESRTGTTPVKPSATSTQSFVEPLKLDLRHLAVPTLLESGTGPSLHKS